MDENGVSHMGELIDVGVEMNILSKSGAFIRYGETLIGQGRPASIAYLKENPKEAERLEKEIRDAWMKQKSGADQMVVGQEDEDGEGVAVIEEAV